MADPPNAAFSSNAVAQCSAASALLLCFSPSATGSLVTTGTLVTRVSTIEFIFALAHVSFLTSASVECRIRCLAWYSVSHVRHWVCAEFQDCSSALRVSFT